MTALVHWLFGSTGRRILKNTLALVVAAGVVALAGGSASAADPTPGFNNKIPEVIMTPNEVESRLGTLKFNDGMPTAETSKLVYDNLDFMRGVETFLNGIPAASIEAIRLGNEKMGVTQAHQAIVIEYFMDANPLFLTGNTGTVYVSAFLDLKRDGPTVMEIPAGMGPGTVNDAFFRFVVDMGGAGPRQGQGRQVSYSAPLATRGTCLKGISPGPRPAISTG
jgi:hypothetical protein